MKGARQNELRRSVIQSYLAKALRSSNVIPLKPSPAAKASAMLGESWKALSKQIADLDPEDQSGLDRLNGLDSVRSGAN